MPQNLSRRDMFILNPTFSLQLYLMLILICSLSPLQSMEKEADKNSKQNFVGTKQNQFFI